MPCLDCCGHTQEAELEFWSQLPKSTMDPESSLSKAASLGAHGIPVKTLTQTPPRLCRTNSGEITGKAKATRLSGLQLKHSTPTPPLTIQGACISPTPGAEVMAFPAWPEISLSLFFS
jgi:hypothetical protein